jgi:hypothetical protein
VNDNAARRALRVGGNRAQDYNRGESGGGKREKCFGHWVDFLCDATRVSGGPSAFRILQQRNREIHDIC